MLSGGRFLVDLLTARKIRANLERDSVMGTLNLALDIHPTSHSQILHIVGVGDNRIGTEFPSQLGMFMICTIQNLAEEDA